MKNTYKDKGKKHGNVYQMYCAKEGLSIDISFCTRRIY